KTACYRCKLNRNGKGWLETGEMPDSSQPFYFGTARLSRKTVSSARMLRKRQDDEGGAIWPHQNERPRPFQRATGIALRSNRTASCEQPETIKTANATSAIGAISCL